MQYSNLTRIDLCSLVDYSDADIADRCMLLAERKRLFNEALEILSCTVQAVIESRFESLVAPGFTSDAYYDPQLSPVDGDVMLYDELEELQLDNAFYNTVLGWHECFKMRYQDSLVRARAPLQPRYVQLTSLHRSEIPSQVRSFHLQFQSLSDSRWRTGYFETENLPLDLWVLKAHELRKLAQSAALPADQVSILQLHKDAVELPNLMLLRPKPSLLKDLGRVAMIASIEGLYSPSRGDK